MKRYFTLKIWILSAVIVWSGVVLYGCKDELIGNPKEIQPPKTQLLPIPKANTPEDPYSPEIEMHWKGVSEEALIDGYWISWKSYYLIRKDSVVQKPFFTKNTSQLIAFPSADSINKQVVLIRAQDNYGNVDPVGATRTFYTKRLYPPETKIIFPRNNQSVFFLNDQIQTWKGVRIICSAETKFDKIEGYSLKLDDFPWSQWQTDSIFYLNKNIYPDLTEGRHDVYIRARNTALVEDPTPAHIALTFVYPKHENGWLLVDDTKDEKGTLEHPSDEQVDQFYDSLLIDVPHDNWDYRQQGRIPREVLGRYKYVFWYSDSKGESNLPNNVGILSDYLNTKGRLLVSGWNIFGLFLPGAAWTDSIQYFGHFLRDYLHIRWHGTIEEALMDTVTILNADEQTREYAPIDTNKIWFFRKGLHSVNRFSIGAFTEPFFFYHSADSTSGYTGSIIGFGYHNMDYQLVVSGVPFYYLTFDGARKAFLRAKEYIEKDFPY